LTVKMRVESAAELSEARSWVESTVESRIVLTSESRVEFTFESITLIL